LIQINGADFPLCFRSVTAKASGVSASEKTLQSSGGASTMSVMFVGAIVALVVLVSAIGGSRSSQRWAIGMYSLQAAALVAFGFSYFVK
jgi:hypothetical protein